MEAIKEQFKKNLNQLRSEIEAFTDDGAMWKTAGAVKNAPATLAIHVCGNLKHVIGASIGMSGFVRDRDAEFSVRGLRKSEIIEDIDTTLKMIEPVLDKLTTSDLERAWPNDGFGEGQTVGSVLLRVGIHLGYHLGQINYLRRLFTEK